MPNSDCCRIELRKAPLFSGREKLGTVYYCPACIEIKYYQGKFAWLNWSVRNGTQGFGAYFMDQGLSKEQKRKKKTATAYKIIPSHGLIRKEMLAADGYVKEPD